MLVLVVTDLANLAKGGSDVGNGTPPANVKCQVDIVRQHLSSGSGIALAAHARRGSGTSRIASDIATSLIYSSRIKYMYPHQMPWFVKDSN